MEAGRRCKEDSVWEEMGLVSTSLDPEPHIGSTTPCTYLIFLPLGYFSLHQLSSRHMSPSPKELLPAACQPLDSVVPLGTGQLRILLSKTIFSREKEHGAKQFHIIYLCSILLIQIMALHSSYPQVNLSL